ncbi:MAG: RNA polymerase factor sigma-54 [Verrucomicrobiales bacterium]|nr:RNA polymerase factor sigma-54 [Verrucomicrobiales bacterium]
MNHSASLEQGMHQQLRLSPQLQQSLHILQAPLAELQQLVRQELVENPTLEAESTDISLEEERPEEKADEEFDEEFNRLSELDEEWRTYLAQSAGATRQPRNAEEEERRQFLLDSIVTPVTLQQHLLEQLQMADASKEDLEFAALLIGNLDDRGLLQTKLEDLSLSMGIPLDRLERAKSLVQSCDPAGVGAEDLRECLLIQLQRLGREHSLESRIVSHHLDDLARRRFPQIARKLAVSVDAVSRAAETIGSLNPRPAADFSAAPSQYINPDVTVEESNGRFVVTLNDDQLPRLRISNLYKDIMSRGPGADVRDYIRNKIQSGKFLIRSIQQRQETIRKIAEQIVMRQEDFLRHGPSHLRPMTMSQVAEATGVHETTVSRAVNGKYLATAQGVFEMKYFFTTGYETADGEQLSNTGVKAALQEVVQGEDRTDPLTDDQIQQELQRRGMTIARRTVAKYREALGILPVHLRRKF